MNMASAAPAAIPSPLSLRADPLSFRAQRGFLAFTAERLPLYREAKDSSLRSE